jgi:hypothetical protein
MPTSQWLCAVLGLGPFVCYSTLFCGCVAFEHGNIGVMIKMLFCRFGPILYAIKNGNIGGGAVEQNIIFKYMTNTLLMSLMVKVNF